MDELRAAQKRLAEEGASSDAPGPPDAARPGESAARAAELEAALAAARADRERLERELASLREGASAGSEAIRAENAELRRRIDEVADQILRAAEPSGGKHPSARDKRNQRGGKRPASA
jgi:uncharacterized protein involved in exopolysaccharide biosynthesis